MLKPEKYPFCTEFYFVEKSVEVVVTLQGEDRRIRIDALHGPDSTRLYSTNAYIEENILVQPAYRQETAGKKPQSIRVWIPYDLPWTDRKSADDAIVQALGFLEERCDKQAEAAKAS